MSLIVPGKLGGCTVTGINGGVTDIVFSRQNCPNLRAVTLPDTVTEIGSRAFYELSGLETVNTPPLRSEP